MPEIRGAFGGIGKFFKGVAGGAKKVVGWPWKKVNEEIAEELVEKVEIVSAAANEQLKRYMPALQQIACGKTVTLHVTVSIEARDENGNRLEPPPDIILG